MSKQTTALERDLAAAMTRLEQLEQRRELLNKEHVDSVSARRTLLLDGADDLKTLGKADDRVRVCETSLAGVEDGLAVLRGKVAQLTTALAAQQDQQQREQKARQVEAQIPIIEEAYVETQAATQKLIAALRASPEIPESEAAARWVEEFVAPLQPEISRIRAMHADRARILRNTPTPPVKPQANPTPTLRLAPERIIENKNYFVDWRP